MSTPAGAVLELCSRVDLPCLVNPAPSILFVGKLLTERTYYIHSFIHSYYNKTIYYKKIYIVFIIIIIKSLFIFKCSVLITFFNFSLDLVIMESAFIIICISLFNRF